jgi:LAS superfamily LD-carboxypeptidase LdcB
VITSAYRCDAEQARLFAPEPRSALGSSAREVASPAAAPSSTSGPASAYRWLAENARRFGFDKQYEWEDWHYETR